MANVLAWSLFALGIGHIVFGVTKFRVSLLGALSSGFVGKFSFPEERRTAFWFLIFAPLLMLAGQVAVHAVAIGDHWLLRLVATYALVTSCIGVAAFPKSPFLAALLLSAFLLLAAYGLL